MNFQTYLKTKLHKYANEKVIITRLFACWFLTTFQASIKHSDTLSLSYIGESSVFSFAINFIICFILFSIVKSLFLLDTDMIFLGLTSTLYSIQLLILQPNPYMLFGICLFQLLYCYYYSNKIRMLLSKLLLSRTMYWIFIVFIILCITIVISLLTICRYSLSRTSTFDMGIFAQMFYNMKEHGSMLTTCERNRVLSHLDVHTSLFYYILLPIYWFFPDPKTLLVCQAMAITIGGIPLVLLCKHFGFTKKMTLAITFVYAFSPATWGGCLYDFHENVFLMPTLLFLFYSYEKNQNIRMILMVLLVCSIKEDAPLFVIIFGLYILISDKNIKAGVCVTTLGIICMTIAFAYLSQNGEGLMVGHYGNLTADGTLLGILKTLLTNPGYLFTQMFTAEKLAFIIAVFMPITILPFMTKKYSRYILFIPFVFVNLLPADVYMYSVFYQYVFATYMFLLYLSLLNLKDAKYTMKQLFCFSCAYLTVFAFSSHISQKTYYLSEMENNEYEIECIEDMIASIPEDASISASTFFVPQLSQREEIFMIDDAIVTNQTAYETDYVVFDLRPGFANEHLSEQISLYESLGYTDYQMEDELYLIMQCSY